MAACGAKKKVQLTVRCSPRFTERQPDVLIILELKHRLDLLAGLVEQLLGHRSDGGVLARVGDSGRRTAMIQQLYTVNRRNR